MAYIIDYLTFDRSHQVFSDDPKAQLKGRDRLIKFNSVSLLVAGILFAFSLAYTLSNLNFVNCILTSAQGAVVVFTLKESILQTIARSAEKEKFNIQIEDETTRYGKSDFTQELSNGASWLKESVISICPKKAE